MKAGDKCPLTRRLSPAELAASCLFSDVGEKTSNNDLRYVA